MNQRSQTGYTLRICPEGTPHYHLMEQYLHPSGLLVFLITLLKQVPRKNPLPLTKGLVAPTKAIFIKNPIPLNGMVCDIVGLMCLWYA